MLPDRVQEDWKRWINQVPVIGFNSGKYDLNLIKKYFVEELAKAEVTPLGGALKHPEIFVARKDNDYMFLTTEKFKFLDIKNFLGGGMSYDKWCKSLGRKTSISFRVANKLREAKSYRACETLRLLQQPYQEDNFTTGVQKIQERVLQTWLCDNAGLVKGVQCGGCRAFH